MSGKRRAFSQTLGTSEDGSPEPPKEEIVGKTNRRVRGRAPRKTAERKIQQSVAPTIVGKENRLV